MADEEELGIFSPDQARRVWRLVRAYERGEFVPVQPDAWIVPESILVKNISGETIPKYSIMQPKTTVDDGGKTYIQVVKPFDYTALLGPFLFSDSRDINPGEFAIAQDGPIFRVKKGSVSLNIGTRVGPLNGSWTIVKGSMYSAIGFDNVDTDIVKVIRNETPILAIAEQEIAPESTGTVLKKEPFCFTPPNCCEWFSGSITYQVCNPSKTKIKEGALCLCFPVDSRWAAVEIC